MFPSPSYSNQWSLQLPTGTLSLTKTSPPQSFVEPLSADTMANTLRLDTPLSIGDAADLADYISAARYLAEVHQGRDLVVKQFDLTLNYWPGRYIPLRPSLVSVDLIQYRDFNGDITTLVPVTDYVVDTSSEPGFVAPSYSKVTWPFFMSWPVAPILIRFTAGLAANDPFWQGKGANVRSWMRRIVADFQEKKLLPGDKELPQAYVIGLSQGASVSVF